MTSRIRKPVTLAIALLTIASLLLTACQAAGPKDLLNTVKARGVMRVSSDPNYKPQSFLNETTKELDGFDIDVSKEVAKRLVQRISFNLKQGQCPKEVRVIDMVQVHER